MSDHTRESIAQALERAISEADLGNAVDNAVRAVEERAPQVRHVVRQAVSPPLPAVRTREGRYNPATMVCIFCNVPKHEHGKVCGRDDYTEWQRVLREAARSEVRVVLSYEQVRKHTAPGGGVVAAVARARG